LIIFLFVTFYNKLLLWRVLDPRQPKVGGSPLVVGHLHTPATFIPG